MPEYNQVGQRIEDNSHKLWPRYNSFKEVHGAEIIRLNWDNLGNVKSLTISPSKGKLDEFVTSVPEIMKKAKVGDMVVVYKDGYKSFVPRESFMTDYSLIKEKR